MTKNTAKRDTTVAIKLTTREDAAVKAHAAEHCLSVSALGRKLLLSHIGYQEISNG